ncbi:fumarylacetoacetate hydrolase family protein [Pseudodonghicola xiamenensis]|uniref:2-hydroxyhepta-2,4-diene-1,7-dioate isomerase n=1 Tax=Pseudodonghicola xiamenensis TaxID=337702 RepID=A0A8J3ME11_9RHOB|nr:fumarylacetoacetate hydrolase family protein [Pseudodonghicola xiamenensis]GHH00121.1 2-hydroxyhepta-2,4-diene-1,7-dioate isomerase [Pseudodonghicola xiamenensis]
MKLARVGEIGRERPAIVDAQGHLRDLSDHIADIDGQTLSGDQLARLAALDPATLPMIENTVRIGSPIAPRGRIICIGLNYTDHAAEVGLPVPEEPTIFLKGCHPTGPNDPLRLPRDAGKTDWEVELGIVIGHGGLYIAPETAPDHIAGYCLLNDVSERSYQMDRGGQWTKGKSFPGFAPVGPWLVTPDEIPDPGALSIWLEVNGRRYQDGNTRNLVHGVAEIVSYVSQFYALEPGDLIATGTPAGVGLGQTPPVFLKPGDVVTFGIDGLGSQKIPVHAWDDVIG